MHRTLQEEIQALKLDRSCQIQTLKLHRYRHRPFIDIGTLKLHRYRHAEKPFSCQIQAPELARCCQIQTSKVATYRPRNLLEVARYRPRNLLEVARYRPKICQKLQDIGASKSPSDVEISFLTREHFRLNLVGVLGFLSSQHRMQFLQASRVVLRFFTVKKMFVSVRLG